jgi:hypothetical protein
MEKIATCVRIYQAGSLKKNDGCMLLDYFVHPGSDAVDTCIVPAKIVNILFQKLFVSSPFVFIGTFTAGDDDEYDVLTSIKTRAVEPLKMDCALVTESAVWFSGTCLAIDDLEMRFINHATGRLTQWAIPQLFTENLGPYKKAPFTFTAACNANGGTTIRSYEMILLRVLAVDEISATNAQVADTIEDDKRKLYDEFLKQLEENVHELKRKLSVRAVDKGDVKTTPPVRSFLSGFFNAERVNKNQEFFQKIEEDGVRVPIRGARFKGPSDDRERPIFKLG